MRAGDWGVELGVWGRRLGAWGLALAAWVVLGAPPASAQTGVTSRWDTAVMTGVFVGRPAASPNDYDRWYQSATLAFGAGRHLTTHLKAEAELMLSGEGSRSVQRLVTVPGVPGLAPYPVSSEQRTRIHGVSAGFAWQFLDNQWAHPFVFGGVALDFDRTRIETWPQSYYRGDPRIPGNEIPLTTHGIEDRGTESRVRAVLGTGAKLYATPRAFFKTDMRVTVGDGHTGHVALRLGFGLDF